MSKVLTQADKAHQLLQLHHSNKLLILPNIWDVLGAKLLENIGYPAVATASASVAFSNGYPDGEKIPFDRVIKNLTQIASSVNLPVTADIESGYANDVEQLENNIRQLIKTGVVGLNFEDTDKSSGKINDISTQCYRIEAIRRVSDEMKVPLFINARTDVLLHNKQFPTSELQQAELLKRGLAYKAAGANCYFPIALKNETSMHEIVTTLKMPLNILTIPGIPGFETLKKIGVSRVSLGPSFLKIAIKAMKALAMDLQNEKGFAAIMENEITTDYLKSLINPST